MEDEVAGTGASCCLCLFGCGQLIITPYLPRTAPRDCVFPYQVAHYHVLVSNWGHHVLPGTWLAQGDEIYVEFYIKGLKENILSRLGTTQVMW